MVGSLFLGVRMERIMIFIDKTEETRFTGYIYIFVSRKGKNKSITRQRAWQVIKKNFWISFPDEGCIY